MVKERGRVKVRVTVKELEVCVPDSYGDSSGSSF